MVTFASPLQPTRPAPASPATPYTPFSLNKKTMSITQTYFLAHKARAKLAKEASRADHDLRLLVGHANLLDGLMVELADAEREQESWFNNSVRGASRDGAAEEQRVEYEDTIIEVPEDDWDSDSSSESSDDDEDEEDIEMVDAMAPPRIASAETVGDDMDDDDEELEEGLGLVRTTSRSSPPELDDGEDSSEDEAMPPSPPNAVLTFSEKDGEDEMRGGPFYAADFYAPPRNPARLVSTISIC
ncbi:hypothetical protein VUR80DRAFT_5117 [Thermomyces stellatus]